MARYTDHEKADAVALYVGHGLAEAHHRTGIPKASLQRWAEAAGQDLSELAGRTADQTRAASQAHAADLEARRVKLRGTLLSAAEHAVAKIVGEEDGNQAKGWAITSGIVIDKLRLELGEATDRTETVAAPERTPEVESELAKVVALADRRAA